MIIDSDNFYNPRHGELPKDENADIFTAFDIYSILGENIKIVPISNFISTPPYKKIGNSSGYIMPPLVKTDGLYIKFRIPPEMKKMGKLIPIIKWAPKSSSVGTTVKLKLKYTFIKGIGQLVDSPIVIASRKTLPKRDFQENHPVVTIFETITVPTNDLDQVIEMEIIRDGTNDTYPDRIGIYEMNMGYELEEHNN